MADDGVFLATFFETREAIANPGEPRDHMGFADTREQMAQFGRSAGWRPEYIGDWGHPVGQVMMRYRPA